MRAKFLAPLCAGLGLALGLSPTASAAETDLVELQNTILNLVDELVNQGVLTAERAGQIKSQAALKAREQAAQAGIAAGRAKDQAPAAAGTASDVIRVPYVPEFVKDELRAEIREELRQDVTNDVVAVAKAEKWGTADALPEWASKLELFGELRLRSLNVFQDSGNARNIPDFLAINQAGGALAAGDNVFFRTTEDTYVGQLRLRTGFIANVTEELRIVTRLATGNLQRVTSRNQRLGTYNAAFEINLDLAYFEWRPRTGIERSGLDLRRGRQLGENVGDAIFRLPPGGLDLRAGRMLNPFFVSTNLAFDEDITYDGISAGYRWNDLAGSDHALFVNGGGFLLLSEEENAIDGGTDAKYWWGGQLGADFLIRDDLHLIVAGAYYDFVNVTGERNEFNSTSRDWTAPQFLQRGNTYFDIRNDLDPNTQLFALASEFRLLNAGFLLDYTGFGATHVTLRGDYVSNIGFDSADVAARVGVPVGRRNQGWMTRLEVGAPLVRRPGDWQLFASYQSLQRDAILDSYADSVFHGGGTDAKGWIAGGAYALLDNVWMRARWMGADEVDGAPAGFAQPFTPLAVDILQVDFSAQF